MCKPYFKTAEQTDGHIEKHGNFFVKPKHILNSSMCLLFYFNKYSYFFLLVSTINFMSLLKKFLLILTFFPSI